MARVEDELASICADLRTAVERLDALAFDALREASAAGARERPPIERRITRARNGLERVLHQLEREPGAGGSGGGPCGEGAAGAASDGGW